MNLAHLLDLGAVFRGFVGHFDASDSVLQMKSPMSVRIWRSGDERERRMVETQALEGNV